MEAQQFRAWADRPAKDSRQLLLRMSQLNDHTNLENLTTCGPVTDLTVCDQKSCSRCSIHLRNLTDDLA